MEQVTEVFTYKSITIEEDYGSIEGFAVSTNEENVFIFLEGEDYLEEWGELSKNQRVAVVKNFYVEEEERGNGYGTELLDAFLSEADFHDVDKVILIADMTENNQMNLMEWYQNRDFQVISNKNSNYPLMGYTF